MKRIFYTALLTGALSIPAAQALAQQSYDPLGPSMPDSAATAPAPAPAATSAAATTAPAAVAVSALDMAAIREIQMALRDSGFTPGPVDGLWGPRTAASMNRFQKHRNLDRMGDAASPRANVALIPVETLDALGIGLNEIRPAAGWATVPARRTATDDDMNRAPASRSMDGMGNTMRSDDVIDNDRLESNNMD